MSKLSFGDHKEPAQGHITSLAPGRRQRQKVPRKLGIPASPWFPIPALDSFSKPASGTRVPSTDTYFCSFNEGMK